MFFDEVFTSAMPPCYIVSIDLLARCKAAGIMCSGLSDVYDLDQCVSFCRGVVIDIKRFTGPH